MRPGWGLFARHISGLTIKTSELSAVQSDGRPAIVVDDVTGLDVFGVSAAGGAAGCQLAVRNTTGGWRGTELPTCKWRPG